MYVTDHYVQDRSCLNKWNFINIEIINILLCQISLIRPKAYPRKPIKQLSRISFETLFAWFFVTTARIVFFNSALIYHVQMWFHGLYEHLSSFWELIVHTVGVSATILNRVVFETSMAGSMIINRWFLPSFALTTSARSRVWGWTCHSSFHHEGPFFNSRHHQLTSPSLFVVDLCMLHTNDQKISNNKFSYTPVSVNGHAHINQRRQSAITFQMRLVFSFVPWINKASI